ncbi:response regulator transcription factor [Flammeovirga pacifica]|uniref:HTH luxR-type domain-containing protein n=1 Tax=Flammeovirga pacifica TaxID=915059 RepID=A0A1S1Z4J5_FLAPC|nr:LuxR C-terminal-related transcriptional regulator [Flammeovirga pacifica]OHX68200.1 hypothetical protein NH26_18525 [Flammeovirga pacifica]
MKNKQDDNFKQNLVDIINRKGLSRNIISRGIKDIDRYDHIKEVSKAFLYPGSTISFIANFDDKKIEFIKKDQNSHMFYTNSNHLNSIIELLDTTVDDEDREMYTYSLDKIFSFHLYLYSKYKDLIHRSSFIFRATNMRGNRQTYFQQNIPVKVNNEEITSFFIAISNVTHITKEQRYVISFFNQLNNDTQIIDVKEFTKPNLDTMNLDLSDREKTILVLISDGLSAKEIGEELHISQETVNRHKKNMIKKNDMKNVIQLATEAIRRGLI